ncbi:hypothetical protein BDN72DRAFT_719622, partial [Pluteus cervinus]
YHTKSFPRSGTVLGQSAAFIDRFNMDAFSQARLENIYYPFSDIDDWEFGSLLMRSPLSMEFIDKMLKLRKIRKLKLSFKNAKTLRNRMEQLPQGPEWKYVPVPSRYATKKKLYVYYRDLLECIEAILQNPLVTEYISYSPVRVYRSAQHAVRVYSEWLTGSAAWEMQEALPKYATLLGVILSSDKTKITNGTGNRAAHPLLMSLANLDIDFRSKSSNNAYLLLAFLPIPKFTEGGAKTVLEARLVHQVLDFITEPAKQAARVGYMMDDAFARLCQQQITRTWATRDPWELKTYITKSRKLRLNGVHKPFWRNWSAPALADPANFLNPDALHHWHSGFHAHDLKWCIYALGAAEIDFRYMNLHPHTGFRRFSSGVTELQQCTMREHRDIQRYIVCVTAGAVEPDFLVAIRALCDFRYRAQAAVLDDDDLDAMDDSLEEFHSHRDAITDAEARRGEKDPIKEWYIPKLETFQNVTRSARSSGAPAQFSAERTENEHIPTVKRPSHKTNNRGHCPQICLHLDRAEKDRMFEIATEIRAATIELNRDATPVSQIGTGSNDSMRKELDDRRPALSTKALLEKVSLAALGARRKGKDYFQRAQKLLRAPQLPTPGPLETITVHNTTIHLQSECWDVMTVDDAARTFRIHDLRSAILHYMEQARRNPYAPHSIGGRRFTSAQPLPFKRVAIWTKCQLQNKTFHPPHSVMNATTINACPPTEKWPAGCFDPVIISTSNDYKWPYSGLQGHCVAQLCLIMLPIPDNDLGPELPASFCKYLTYCRRFDIIPQLDPNNSGPRSRRGPFPDPITSLYNLWRARRTNLEPTGDIIPIQQLRSPVDLVPKFGKKADPRLTRETSLAYIDEFYLNKYFTKEMFYSLT